MKSLLAIILVMACISCETDIKLLDDTGYRQVVYCLLNQNDTTQKIRLSRTYLSSNGQTSPLSEDSLIINDNLRVTVEAYTDLNLIGTYSFHSVDMTKDSGFFPSGNQYYFESFFPILNQATYRLIVEIKDRDYIAFSSIAALGDFSLIDPAYPAGRAIHILDDHNLIFHWTKCNNAAVYQVGFRLNFREINGDSIQEKSVPILFTTVFVRDDPGLFYSYSVNSTQYYKKLAELIPVNNQVLREFISIDSFVIAGSESLGIYLNALNNQDPFHIYDYKNILNGTGLFGSIRTRKTDGFQLDRQSLDTLAYGRFTNQLNFLDSDGHRKDL
jgi:hypothetical protein